VKEAPVVSDASIRKLLAVLEQFRELDPEMPSQTISAFLTIALNPGFTVREVEHALGLSVSASSRNVAILSPRSVVRGREQPGLGLVEYRLDPEDARRKEIHLTKDGRRKLEAILAIMREH
jgi:DNA-binding MarR family transcriptional regulator